MEELLRHLMSLGYTVTFEGSEVGDYFVLLRRIETMELVNCSIADSPLEALQGAAAWVISGADGNGTASRPVAARA